MLRQRAYRCVDITEEAPAECEAVPRLEENEQLEGELDTSAIRASTTFRHSHETSILQPVVMRNNDQKTKAEPCLNLALTSS